jgi:hypothetical protein
MDESVNFEYTTFVDICGIMTPVSKKQWINKSLHQDYFLEIFLHIK